MTRFSSAFEASIRYNKMPMRANDPVELLHGLTAEQIEGLERENIKPLLSATGTAEVERTLKTSIWDSLYCDLFPSGCGFLIFDSALRFTVSSVRIWLLIYSDMAVDSPLTEASVKVLLKKYSPRGFIEHLDLLGRRKYRVRADWDECKQYMLNRQTQARLCALRMLKND